jgi:hypothetical protein
VSATLDEQVQAMTYEDRRALATALLYTCLSGSAGKPHGHEARMLRRAMVILKQVKSTDPQPQPQNPT